MENFQQPNNQKSPRSANVILGVIFFLAGLTLLAYKLGAPLPSWLFTWPMILIVIGIALGVKDQFQNPGAWILLLIGSIFLADRTFEGFDAHKYIGPIVLIFIGMLIIFKPRHRRRMAQFSCKSNIGGRTPDNENSPGIYDNDDTSIADDEEYLNINSVFGGVKKFIVSKNFKGGTVVTFMGGAELNLLQADIKHPIILELNNVFGGTKLLVPSNWDIKNEVTAIFGGIDDKRNVSALAPDPGKIVLIKGSSIFGGIEISSY